jgi:Flp pilus assembly protein TadG
MWKLIRDNGGASAVEFALAVAPTIGLIFGIVQTGYLVWTDNLLHVAVNTAARCGGVGSTTLPCAGSDMISTANSMFLPLSGATFTANTGCSSETTGLVGTYDVTIGMVASLTLTATSCYPVLSTN